MSAWSDLYEQRRLMKQVFVIDAWWRVWLDTWGWIGWHAGGADQGALPGPPIRNIASPIKLMEGLPTD